jgi:hypothetical protein
MAVEAPHGADKESPVSGEMQLPVFHFLMARSDKIPRCDLFGVRDF